MLDYTIGKVVPAQYHENCISLLDSVQQRKCVAFFGAGLSSPYKYPTWGQSMDGADFGGIRLVGLCERSGISEAEKNLYLESDGSYDFPKLTDACKAKMNNDQWDLFVKEAFGKRDDFRAVDEDTYSNLFHTDFYSYITTNFDPCANLIGERIIPHLSVGAFPTHLSVLSELALHYIHGAAFEIPPNYVPQIVFSESQYKDAYENTMVLSTFFDSLSKYDLALFGYGGQDQSINRSLIVLKNTIRLRQKTLAAKLLVRERKNYIVLPFVSVKSLVSSPLSNAPELTVEERIAEEDGTLRDAGFVVIRFTMDNEPPFENLRVLTNRLCKMFPIYHSELQPLGIDADLSRRVRS